MEFENISTGIDIEEINRFKNKTPKNDAKFLERIFTKKEIEYCFSKGIAEQHLCARYCGKEAVVKALSEFGIKDVYCSDIEILNREDGSPYAVINKYPEIKIKVSLSHSKTYATASVLLYYVKSN